MRIWPGAPYPLGATWDGWGTNFTLFSEVAERVELCLFSDADADDGAGRTEAERTGSRVVDGDANQGEAHIVHPAHVGSARKNLAWARELGLA